MRSKKVIALLISLTLLVSSVLPGTLAVSIDQDAASSNVVTITNTRSLIQTGQLNWPIWVLGGAGLVLVALGGAMLVKKKKHNA